MWGGGIGLAFCCYCKTVTNLSWMWGEAQPRLPETRPVLPSAAAEPRQVVGPRHCPGGNWFHDHGHGLVYVQVVKLVGLHLGR